MMLFPENVASLLYWLVIFKPEMRVRHWLQRLVARSRSLTVLNWRGETIFRASTVEQNGVLLLMPCEHLVGVYLMPLAILCVFLGGGIGAAGMVP